MAEIYNDGTYLTNNPTWHEEGSEWKSDKIKLILERNSVEPNLLCEVGCGAGEIIRLLAQHFPESQCEGYDISEQAYQRCKAKSADNLSYYHADLLETDKQFDLVMAIDVFEHIEDYFSFLRKLRKKAELKLFHIPIELSAFNVIRQQPLMKAREGVGHLHFFTKDTALAVLKDSGYEVIDYFYTSHSELSYISLKSKLMGIFRQLLFRLNQDFAARALGGYSLMVLTR